MMTSMIRNLLVSALVLFSFTCSPTPSLPPKPAACPEGLLGFIGEYAHNSDTLYVLENGQKLILQTKKDEILPLEFQNGGSFRFAAGKLSNGAGGSFEQNKTGVATGLKIGPRLFARMFLGGEGGGTFRITPLRPVADLRREALNASPPVENGQFLKPMLVEVISLDSTIKLDIRYASTNNFASTPFYSQAKAFLQRTAAEGVVLANRKLKSLGYGLLIHDAYRPWYVTKMFWEATPEDKRIFVADPSKGSRHNRGCAVDITLYDLQTGAIVEMPSGYDEFSERAYPHYPGGTSLQRWHRELLKWALEQEGFKVYEWEWWHFDFQDWQKYPIGTLTFEQVESGK
jgi:serine beta-lactamase-like protein LACTB